MELVNDDHKSKNFIENIYFLDDEDTESMTETIVDLSLTSPENRNVKTFAQLGQTCTNDYFCQQSIAKSYCNSERCTCLDGYVISDSFTCIESKIMI